MSRDDMELVAARPLAMQAALNELPRPRPGPAEDSGTLRP